ncbi:hypothetical protein ACFQ2B_11995 [Streptomyces stramineus]
MVGSAGQRVQLRRPGGGLEWEVPFAVLRLATREEREVAGLWPALRPLFGCAECAELSAAQREAAKGDDADKAGDALVAQRSHWRMAHTLPGGPV